MQIVKKGKKIIKQEKEVIKLEKKMDLLLNKINGKEKESFTYYEKQLFINLFKQFPPYVIRAFLVKDKKI